MARYTGAVCRICRREGVKLFLKGERCYSDKCAIERRSYPPGQHGQGRPKFSEYSLQLREKQKLKRMFGMLESQFRKTFQEAERVSGITGENLLIHLERRLDNIVYRLGFASSRSEARQLVGHGRVRVNGRRVSIPSFPISTGHVVELELKCRQWPKVAASLEGMQRRGLPEWLDLNREEFRGTVKYLPRRSDLTTSINEKLIVELYSK